MKIYTKQGDDGTTGLYRHGRVPKSHPLIEAIGSVDELNSVIGIVMSGDISSQDSEQLCRVQHHLFDLGAELASRNPELRSVPDSGDQDVHMPDSESGSATPQKVDQLKLTSNEVEMLEEWIDGRDEDLEPLTQFILPGGHPAAAAVHHARTICRRAEREVGLLAMHLQYSPIESQATVYLNRLSDYLFVLARSINAAHQCSDVFWQPGLGASSEEDA